MDLQSRIREFLADFDAIDEWEGNDQLCAYLSDAVAMLREVAPACATPDCTPEARQREEAQTQSGPPVPAEPIY